MDFNLLSDDTSFLPQRLPLVFYARQVWWQWILCLVIWKCLHYFLLWIIVWILNCLLFYIIWALLLLGRSGLVLTSSPWYSPIKYNNFTEQQHHKVILSLYKLRKMKQFSSHVWTQMKKRTLPKPQKCSDTSHPWLVWVTTATSPIIG